MIKLLKALLPCSEALTLSLSLNFTVPPPSIRFTLHQSWPSAYKESMHNTVLLLWKLVVIDRSLLPVVCLQKLVALPTAPLCQCHVLDWRLAPHLPLQRQRIMVLGR
jgi:hypothetical protein